jgi:hypothetical protein
MSLALMAALLGMLARVPPSHGAEWTCAAGDIPCLVEAIHVANTNGEANMLTLAAGTYTLTAVDNDTDGPNGLPSVTGSLSITGAGAEVTIVERAAGAPPFRLLHVSVTGTLTLEGLTLWGGYAATTNLGGAIFSRGFLTITNSTLLGNLASGDGGAIVFSGALTITNSTLLGNLANGSGGGIRSIGALTIANSTLQGNLANGSGGGIAHSGGSLTITDSTLSGNSSNASGGGISFVSPGGAITNSTLRGNVAARSGGGIEIGAFTLTLTNSTVSGNLAGQGGGIRVTRGGGVLIPPGQAILVNTILAQNEVLPAGTGADCTTFGGQVISHGHNLIGDPSGCTITLLPTDLTGDPGLGPFTDDGTPGQAYLPLLPTSRAIDAGDPAACPATDQLGQFRITPCDIGAVEFAPVTVTLGLNQASVYPGDTLRVRLGLHTLGPTVTADAYLGIVLPDGVSVLFVTGLAPLNGVVTRLDADPRTFAPLAPAYTFPTGENVIVEDFFVYTLTGAESPGTYALFTMLTPPGAFADGRVDAMDLLGLTHQAFAVSP